MRPISLPRAASGLRGRDSELAAVQRLLTHERLVTVLGAGGVGKSALVAEIAARADHVTVVPLAPITDPPPSPRRSPRRSTCTSCTVTSCRPAPPRSPLGHSCS